MTQRTRLFIASSSQPQSLQVVQILKQLLEESAGPPIEVAPWHEDFHPGGKTIIETLEEIAERSDFALMVLGEDDVIRVAGEPHPETASGENLNAHRSCKAPRDNVIFELGLFSGLMGRERCMVVYDKGKGLKLPTDIAGIVAALYEQQAAGDLRAALSVAVAKIRRKLGSEVPAKKPSRSEIEAWDAARQFSRSIAGYWWGRRHWSQDSIGFINLSIDPADLMPKVFGRAYSRDGERVAEWSSVAACVLAPAGRLYFRFEGHHPPTRPGRRNASSEEYRGFSEYKFDPPLDNPTRGNGALSDLNVKREVMRPKLTLELRRCLAQRDIDAMESGDRARIADVVQGVLPRPSPLTSAKRYFLGLF
jgi:predicted nucleotide-binding protein